MFMELVMRVCRLKFMQIEIESKAFSGWQFSCEVVSSSKFALNFSFLPEKCCNEFLQLLRSRMLLTSLKKKFAKVPGSQEIWKF